MSDILARIRVKETHGIRRFLYPLTAYVSLPTGTNTDGLSLATPQGQAVPLQVTPSEAGQFRLDFALSLAPLQDDTELLLMAGGPQTPIPNPLNLTYLEDGSLRSEQERFQITLGAAGEVRDVVYDTVPHLDSPLSLQRTDMDNLNYRRGMISAAECAARFGVIKATEVKSGGGPLCAWSRTRGSYADGRTAQITTEITACKSWVTLHYHLEQPRPNEFIHLWLPLGGDFSAPNPSRTIFDTGINGIYGQADYWGAFLNWYAPASPEEAIRWEIGKSYIYEDGQNLSRTDYLGTTASETEFQQQRWLHMSDGTKAIAMAITKMPQSWSRLEIRMRKTLTLEFVLSEKTSDPLEFSVCYHFLNDVPAIAAATNPQSILLPPTVEMLPGRDA